MVDQMKTLNGFETHDAEARTKLEELEKLLTEILPYKIEIDDEAKTINFIDR